MAANLVSDIIRMASPAIIDKLAQMLGINAGVVQKGLMAAVPAIIGMLVNKSSTPTGASDILASLTKANPDVGGGLLKSLTGAAGGNFAQAGSGMLGSLFGDSTASVLGNVVGKYAGLDGKAGGSLMGAATQMVLGGLAQQKSAGGLDASGLASLLSAQKNNVAEAMPAGLGALLAAAPGLGSSFSGFSGAAAKTTAAAREATQSVNRMATNAAPAANGTNWLPWVAALVVIAGGAWYFLSGSPTPPPATTTTTEQPATTTPPATTTEQPATTTQPATTPAAPSLVVDGVDVGKSATDAIGGFTSLLGGITDAASAQAAVAKLQDGGAVIDGLTATVAKFAPEQKVAFVNQITPAIASLQAAVAKAMAIPGVGEVLKPVIEPLLLKVSKIAL